MNRLVISTVGTSLLTNQIDREFEENWANRLRDTANLSQGEIAKHHEDVSSIIISLQERAADKLNGKIEDIREASAELNGIYGLYKEQLNQGDRDIHWLIVSDTAQDQVTAKMLEEFLRQQGLNVDVYTPPGFSARSTEAFTNGIDELLNWIDETVPGYKDSGYQICFNLVGGFKAIQGCANTIGMFYADEIIYIFEGSRDIITIPRLPIKVDISVIKPVQFALMAAGAWVAVSELKNVPETLIFKVDDTATLTTWGRLIWNRSKEDLLSGDLLQFPKLKYESSFKRDYDNITEKNERVKLQETLAQVSYKLQESNGDTSVLANTGLKYDPYEGTKGVDHFRVTLSLRISCKVIGNDLSLRYYGTHNHVQRSEGIKGK
ncbi:MAG: putative CRISPR-associated protein [Coleofasciculus sp. S288]|nr:putative CRISPR-associated protein [Coleofasciculus sp. S288]